MDNAYQLHSWTRMRRKDALRGRASDTFSTEPSQSAGSVSDKALSDLMSDDPCRDSKQ